MNSSAYGLFLTFLTVFSWSLLAIVLKITSKFLDSNTIVGMRFIISVISLLFVILLNWKNLKPSFKSPPILMSSLGGLFLAGNYITYMYGIELGSVSNSQLFIQVGPLSLFLWGVFFCKESINYVQIVGLILSLLGFYFFYQDHIENFLGQELVYQLGSLWTVVSALSWATFALIQRRLVQSNSALVCNILIFSFASLFFIPSLDINSLKQLTMGQSLILLYLGLNTTFAYGCLSLAFRHLEASRISTILTLGPIITLLLMNFFHYFNISDVAYEPVRLAGYTGVSLVVLGAIIVIAGKNKSSPVSSD